MTGGRVKTTSLPVFISPCRFLGIISPSWPPRLWRYPRSKAIPARCVTYLITSKNNLFGCQGSMEQCSGQQSIIYRFPKLLSKRVIATASRMLSTFRNILSASAHAEIFLLTLISFLSNLSLTMSAMEWASRVCSKYSQR